MPQVNESVLALKEKIINAETIEQICSEIKDLPYGFKMVGSWLKKASIPLEFSRSAIILP